MKSYSIVPSHRNVPARVRAGWSDASQIWARPIDPTIRTIMMMLTLGLYLLFRFALLDLLPAKFMVDAGTIADILAGQDIGTEGDSFNMTASMFALFPEGLQTGLVVSLGCAMIVMTFRVLRSWGGVITVLTILFPLLILGLVAPSKETLVIMISFVILAASRLGRGFLPVMVSCLVLYLAYGSLVRDYYLLILGLFLALVVYSRLPMALRIVVAILATSAILLVPNDIFMQLQGTRDESNTYAQYIAFSDNRTAFFNPLVPDSLGHFLVNYVYAAILLNFPFVSFLSARDMVLFINVLIYASLVRTSLRHGAMREKTLATLFLSHVLVLWLFEPDLGSYFRHFSSVFAYLIPALALREQRFLIKREVPCPATAM